MASLLQQGLSVQAAAKPAGCTHPPPLPTPTPLPFPILQTIKQFKVVNADNGISMGGVDFLTIDSTRFEFTKPRWAGLSWLQPAAGWELPHAYTHACSTVLSTAWSPRALVLQHRSHALPCPALPCLFCPALPCHACSAPRCRGIGKAKGMNGHHALWTSRSSDVLFSK